MDTDFSLVDTFDPLRILNNCHKKISLIIGATSELTTKSIDCINTPQISIKSRELDNFFELTLNPFDLNTEHLIQSLKSTYGS